ncbi:hypothetical protein HYQ46_004564 [Verticillium longisporum]|nr:hypothetical protein HYQ46_004564 [Verticillium longisporum]
MQDQDTTSDEDDDDDDANDSPSEANPNMVKFIPSACLFCPETSRDFEASLSHMHQAHSLAIPFPLVIPFQSSLAVDLQTLLWFLHMTIFSYRECICCGTRRRTVVAVQQHMLAAGHCRFNVTSEMSELYDVDSLNRNVLDLHALARRDRKEQALTAGMAQLRAADRMSLVRLPQGQQRSLLVARKNELDRAKRAERRTRGRMDHVGNMTAIHTNYYKQEVPVYMGG